MNPNHSLNQSSCHHALLRFVLRHAGAVLLAAASIGVAHAGDGDPDPTFAGDGKAYAFWSGGNVQDVHISVGASGAVLVGGTHVRPDGDRDFAIARFLNDGSVDNSFGFAGARTISFDYVPDGYDNLEGIFPLSNGKLLLLGRAEIAGQITAAAPPAMLRLDSAGNLDTSFGEDGRRVFSDSPWPAGDYFIRAVTRLPDGKFLFGGHCYNCPGAFPDPYRAVVLRVDANGVPDASFGNGGWATIVAPEEPRLDHINVDTQGRIVLAGALYYGDARLPLIMRMTATGQPDTTFGNGAGISIITNLPDSLATGWGVAAITTDRYGALFLAVKNLIALDIPRTGLVRLDPAGALDTTFGTDGLLDLTLEEGSRIETLAMRSDHRLVAAGKIDHTGGSEDFFIARATPEGDLDNSFDGNGVKRIPMSDDADSAQAMTLASGKPLIAGYAYLDGGVGAGVLRVQSEQIFADGYE